MRFRAGTPPACGREKSPRDCVKKARPAYGRSAGDVHARCSPAGTRRALLFSDRVYRNQYTKKRTVICALQGIFICDIIDLVFYSKATRLFRCCVPRKTGADRDGSARLFSAKRQRCARRQHSVRKSTGVFFIVCTRRGRGYDRVRSFYEDYCGCHHLEEQLMRPLRNLIAGSREYPTVTKE